MRDAMAPRRICSPAGRASRMWAWIAAGLLCSCAGTPQEARQARIEHLAPEDSGELTDRQLRLQVMRFADTYNEAFDEACTVLEDPAMPVATRYRLRMLRTAVMATNVDIAAGPDAEINLLTTAPTDTTSSR